MGVSNSKKKGKKKGSSDDGCIGNRRVRTIILSLILIVFCIFALPYVMDIQESAADAQDGSQSDIVASRYHSINLVTAGLFITLVGSICAIVLFFIPGCDDKLGKVAGFVLILGGLLYCIGFIWWEVVLKDLLMEETLGISAWAFMTDEMKQQYDASMWARIGEALLFSISAILLGIDAMLQWYEDEAKRLSSNLGLIMTVSLMCCSAYLLQICGEDETICLQRDGVEAIATGYIVLFWTTLVYIVLYICTCCTCDCKDNCLVRLVLAIALVVGGVLCSIGYYVYSGGIDDASDDDIGGKRVAFYIGYTVLIGGLCIVWALDIALDDVKNR